MDDAWAGQHAPNFKSLNYKHYVTKYSLFFLCVPTVMFEAKNACVCMCMLASDSGKPYEYVRLSGHQEGSKEVVPGERLEKQLVVLGQKEPENVLLV